MTLPRTAWVRLNCFHTNVGRFRTCLYNWGMASSAACECGDAVKCGKLQIWPLNHKVLQSPSYLSSEVSCKLRVIIFDITLIIPEIKDILFIGQEHMFKLDVTSSLFFAETFWSFHLSHVCIKISDNSIHKLIFSNITTELT